MKIENVRRLLMDLLFNEHAARGYNDTACANPFLTSVYLSKYEEHLKLYRTAKNSLEAGGYTVEYKSRETATAKRDGKIVATASFKEALAAARMAAGLDS